MQHDEKLETMKLMMLSCQGGYHGTSILILILVRRCYAFSGIFSQPFVDGSI
jgi:hypothetical protein